MNPVYVYIETEPLKNDVNLSEEELSKLINPIDSKIIAIGVLFQEKKEIFFSSNEEDVIKSFWDFLRSNKGFYKIIGFNAKKFELPFITTRSFILDIEIEPFSLKNIVDLRELISAFKFGQSRGKLSEFGKIFKIEINEENIKEKISSNLNIIKEMHKRVIKTKIEKITKF